jgi:hypothetical protein
MRRLIVTIGLILWGLMGIHAQDSNPDDAGSLRVQVNTITPYVGEPVIYTVRTSINERIDPSVYRLQPPTFNGLGQASTLPPPRTETETRDGITYNVTVQDYVLYPLRAGDVDIEPFELEIGATAFTDNQFLRSNRISLNVQALPDDAPDSFDNAVGQYDITETLTPDTIQRGQPTTLRITIEGSGNIEQISAPELALDDTWRIFDDGSTYQQDTVQVGSKTFQWTIIPDASGVLTLPPVEFSFFNPQTGSYEERFTRALSLTVESAVGATEVNNTVPTAANTTIAPTVPPTQPPPATNTPIVPDTTFDERDDAPALTLKDVPDRYVPITPEREFWLLWLIAPMLFVLMLTIMALLGRFGHRQTGSAVLRQTANRLKRVRTISDLKEAYAEVNDIIMQYLSYRANTPITDANLDEILSQLPLEVQKHVEYCLTEAESGQYAPVSEKDLLLLVSRTRQTLREVDRAWRT